MSACQPVVLALSLSVLTVACSAPPAPADAPPAESAATVAVQSPLARGEYLVTVGGCDDCHSPKVFGPAGEPLPDMARRLSGHPAADKVPPVPAGLISPTGWAALGNGHFTAWAGPWGVSFAANLTPDQTTGLGSWTGEMFINALRTGKHQGTGRAILPPMPWFNFAKMTDEDLLAVFTYLRSLPPVVNAVPEPIPPAAPAR